MKKIIGVLALIVVLGLITPKFVGDKAHQAFQQSVEEQIIAQSSLVIQKNNYKQSWFSSDSEVVLQLSLGDEDLDAIAWYITSHIQHGPVMWTNTGLKWGTAYVTSSINVTGLPGELQQFVDDKLGHDAITATSLIDFQQVLHDTLTLKSFHVEGDKITGNIGGIQLTSTDAIDLSSMKGQAKIVASDMSSPDLTLAMTDALVKYDYKLWQDDIMLGTSSFTVPQLKAATAQGDFVFNDVAINTEQHSKQGKLELFESIEVKAIQAPLPVTALYYDIAIHQLDPQVLSQFDAVQKSIQDGVSDNTPPLQNEALQKLLTMLFQKDLSVDQKLMLAALGGTLNIQADARYVGLADGQQLVDVLGTETALQALDIHIVADVDKSVVEQLPFGGMVGVLVGQGVVNISGDKFTTDIKLAKGALTVNDKAMPVNMLYPWLGITTATDEEVLDN